MGQASPHDAGESVAAGRPKVGYHWTHGRPSPVVCERTCTYELRALKKQYTYATMTYMYQTFYGYKFLCVYNFMQMTSFET